MQAKTMKKLYFAALLCAFASASFAETSTAAQTAPVKGELLLASNGSRLGTVYRVGADGSAQIIIDGRMVSVPASTLSVANGKVTTSLSKSEVLALH
jgi:hypothetical protein